MRTSFRTWVASGDPWIWLTGGAISICLIAVAGLLILIAVRGLGHFWPEQIAAFNYTEDDGTVAPLLGELVDMEIVPRAVMPATDARIPVGATTVDRLLVKTGNRDLYGIDFRWVVAPGMSPQEFPRDAVAVERREWGNFYGYFVGVKAGGAAVPAGEDPWATLEETLSHSNGVFEEIRHIEKNLIGGINYGIERLRLDERRLQLDGVTDPAAFAKLDEKRAVFEAEYKELGGKLSGLYEDLNRASVVMRTVEGREVEIPAGRIVRAYRPNSMSTGTKVGFYFTKLWEFMVDEPREANTEGGIFPAIFGTVMMVIIMAILVTPFGVIAAVYLWDPLESTCRHASLSIL